MISIPKIIKGFFILFFLLFIRNSYPASYPDLIQKANQLFAQHKYTESLDLFEQAHQLSEKASPDIFIKMALIHEGLGNYTQALYYLNLYYVYSPNYQTLLHMERLGQTFGLKGYDHSDLDLFKAFYFRNFSWLAILALAVSIVSLGWLLWNFSKERPVLFTIKLALLLLISLIFMVISFIEVNPKGIIQSDRSFLMSAPSSGARVVDIIEKGHRVNILGKQDIWYRIEWKEQELFIRSSQILAVPGLNDNRRDLF